MAESPIRPNKYNLPLPTVCHAVLDEKTIAGRDVFIIGDVHGCYDEMCELMDLARRQRDHVMFVFAGDILNKGPKSVDAIRKVRSMGAEAFAVRGNHEECVLREVRDSRADEQYELRDRYMWIKDLSDEDVAFIQELPYTISIPSLKVLVLHAGILPGIPLEEQRLYHFTNVRNIVVKDNDSSSSEELEGISKIDRGQSWTAYWKGPEHVYFGHDARRGLQLCEFATGLDTGCVYGKCLTGTFASGPRTRLSVKCSWQHPCLVGDDDG